MPVNSISSTWNMYLVFLRFLLIFMLVRPRQVVAGKVHFDLAQHIALHLAELSVILRHCSVQIWRIGSYRH